MKHSVLKINSPRALTVLRFGLDIPMWPKTILHSMDPREAKKVEPSGIIVSHSPTGHDSPPQRHSPILLSPLKVVGDEASQCHVSVHNSPTLVYVCTNTSQAHDLMHGFKLWSHAWLKSSHLLLLLISRAEGLGDRVCSGSLPIRQLSITCSWFSISISPLSK